MTVPDRQQAGDHRSDGQPLVERAECPARRAAPWGAGRQVSRLQVAAVGAAAAGRMAATGAAAGGANGLEPGVAVGPPGGKVGNLIVGAAEGLGGRLMRTVSFLGCTLEASGGLGGTAPPGKLGMLSAIYDCFHSN